MSKQSNQRYRKEKEKETMKDTGSKSLSSERDSSDKDKVNYREFDSPSGKADK